MEREFVIPNQNIVVAIIGGGASGVLTALHLLASDHSLEVHLFNSGHELGGGIAYSVSGDDLLLNVPASGMSAWSERPDDFYQWLETHHPSRYSRTSFVPRRLYRDYLRSVLSDAASNASPGCLRHRNQWVNEILPKKRGFLIKAGDGSETLAETVVLALGNCLAKGRTKEASGTEGDARIISSPWQYLSKPRPPTLPESILLLGSGLTAVDVIIGLREHGHKNKVLVFSRRGRWPAEHFFYQRQDTFALPVLEGLSPRNLLRAIRTAVREVTAQGGDWRQAIDALRPSTNGLWAHWTELERARFLRHARTYWDVHRHRMAPEVARKLQKELVEKAVCLQAARVVSITGEREGLRVLYRRRGSSQTESVVVGQVLDCMGVNKLTQGDSQHLVEGFLHLDLARLDALLPGLSINDSGELLDAAGHSVSNVFAIGPVRRGTLWETTALPEIRAQAEQLAKDIVFRCRNLTRLKVSAALHHVSHRKTSLNSNQITHEQNYRLA